MIIDAAWHMQLETVQLVLSSFHILKKATIDHQQEQFTKRTYLIVPYALVLKGMIFLEFNVLDKNRGPPPDLSIFMAREISILAVTLIVLS